MYIQWSGYLTLSGFTMENLATSYAGPVTAHYHVAGTSQTGLFAVLRASSNSDKSNNSNGDTASNTSVLLTVQASTMVVAFDTFVALTYNTPSLFNYWVVKAALSLSAKEQAALNAKFVIVEGVTSDPNHLTWTDDHLLTWRWQNLTLSNPAIYPLTTVLNIGYLNLTYHDNAQFFVPPPALFQVMSLADVAQAVIYTLGAGALLSRSFGQTIVVCSNMSGNTPAQDAKSSLYPFPAYAPSACNGSTAPPAGPVCGVDLAAADAIQGPPSPLSPPLPSPAVNLIENITLPVVLAYPTTLTTWQTTVVCWDMQQAPALLSVNATAPVTVRLMSLMNLPPHQSSNRTGADPTLRLVSALWTFHTDSADGSAVLNSTLITLDRVTLHVPSTEVQLFLSAARLPMLAGALPLSVRGQSIMQRAVVSYQVESYGRDWIFYSNITTMRWHGTNVNLTAAVPSACSDYPAMDVHVSFDDITAAVSPSHTADAFPAWAVGLLAGVVGALALVAALSGMLVRSKRRKQNMADLDPIINLECSVTIGCGEEANREMAVKDIPPIETFSGSFTGPGTFNMIDSVQDMPVMHGSIARSSSRICPKALALAYTNENLGVRDEQLQISGVLGRGGHGVVYKGMWKGLPVAAKMMIVHEERQEQARRQMLEATLSASLSHPNIVSTYSYDLTRLVLAPCAGLSSRSGLSSLALTQSESSFGSVTGASSWQLLIVQELCSGGTMRAMIDGNALMYPSEAGADALRTSDNIEAARLPNLVHILQLALDVALGLEHLHSKNVVHSDVNPNNVLLQEAKQPRAAGLSWVAKVADFGLSVAFDEGTSHASKVFTGTPFYFAPETQSHGLLSKASDVFAFGILLSEMMSGRITRAALLVPSSALPMAPMTASSLVDSVHDVHAAGHLDAPAYDLSSHRMPRFSDHSPAACKTEEPDKDAVCFGGRSTHIVAPADFAHMALPSTSISTADSARPPLLGGGGGIYGAARTLPALPQSCPEQYCELVANCLNPVAGKRPTIESVCRCLSLLACDHIPGYRVGDKVRSNSSSAYEVAVSGATCLGDQPTRARETLGRRSSMPLLLGRVRSGVKPYESISEDEEHAARVSKAQV